MHESWRGRERFHLIFLRAFARKFAGRPYAVKGGICLRSFHGLPRLSEDIDLDITQVASQTLTKGVEGILHSPPFRMQLEEGGISLQKFTSPKQTATTQRWKIELRVSGGLSLSTTVEFSRRSKVLPLISGPPHPALLSEHNIPLFIAQYYSKEEMVKQKILALANPVRMAARDMFDLYHLVIYHPPLGNPGMGHHVLQEAREKIGSISFATFKGEVIPFLPADLAMFYGERENYQKIVSALISILGNNQ